MSAKSSGGGKTNRRAKDQAQAAYMQKHPGAYPDSVMRAHTPRIGTPKMAFEVRPSSPVGMSHHDRALMGAYLLGVISADEAA